MPSHIKLRNQQENIMLSYIRHIPEFEDKNSKNTEYLKIWRDRILDEIQDLKHRVNRIDRMPLSQAKEQAGQYHLILESKINHNNLNKK